MTIYETTRNTEALDRLPELPTDVQVPDDISDIHPPTTPKPTVGVRWMRWLAAIVLLGTAGVLTAVLLRNNDTEQVPADYMEVYGTDNPAFVSGAAGAGTVVIAGTPDLMKLYGTDNPAFMAEPTLMDLYGTDNPAFVTEPTLMELYGTDNPVFVTEPTLMDLYGTDNPVFVPVEVEPEPVDTGEYLRQYGTDNPTFEE